MRIKEELAALERMSAGELAERFTELTGEPVRTRHSRYLIRRVARRSLYSRSRLRASNASPAIIRSPDAGAGTAAPADCQTHCSVTLPGT